MMLHSFSQTVLVEEGPCEAGSFFPRPDRLYKLKQPVSKLASILLGELVAILISVKYIQTENNQIINYVKIFSDDQSAVGILTLGWETKTYKQTVKEIQDLPKKKKGVTIKIEWTPGHANILGNEIADTLAKEAAQEAKQMKEEESVTAMTDIRKGAKESCFVKWQRKWELTEAGRHLFNLRPTVKSKDKFISHSKNLEILRQLRTGYTKLDEYNHKIDSEKSPYCSWKP